MKQRGAQPLGVEHVYRHAVDRALCGCGSRRSVEKRLPASAGLSLRFLRAMP